MFVYKSFRSTVTSNGSPYAIGPLSVLSVCNVGVLWPNGWMDQDVTWYRGRPRPRPQCVRWGPSSPHEKGHSSPPPDTFRPSVLRHGRPSQQLLSSCSVSYRQFRSLKRPFTLRGCSHESVIELVENNNGVHTARGFARIRTVPHRSPCGRS